MSYDFGLENAGGFLRYERRVTTNPKEHHSYACWFYPTNSTGPDKYIMGQFSRAVGSRQQQLHFEDGGVVQYNNLGVSTDVSLTSTTVPNLNEWIHMAVADTGKGYQELWINGVSEATDSVTVGQRNDIDTTVFGARMSGGTITNEVAGFGAEFGIWNRLITFGEVQKMAGGASPAFFSGGLKTYLSGGPEQRFDIDPGFKTEVDAGSDDVFKRGQHPNIYYPVLRRGAVLVPAAPAPAAEAGPVPKKWMHYARLRRTA